MKNVRPLSLSGLGLDFAICSFSRSSSGGCTFDSLAFRITIPRFYVRVCVCVWEVHTMPSRHFEIAICYARDAQSSPATDWYAATDNVSLSTFSLASMRAVEMKSKPALVPLPLPRPMLLANLVSRVLKLFTRFFLSLFRLLEQLPRILRSFGVARISLSRGSWCSGSLLSTGLSLYMHLVVAVQSQRYVIPMTQRRHMSINHAVFLPLACCGRLTWMRNFKRATYCRKVK